MLVSVVVTVLNEGNAIARLLDSLLAQTRRPDEVVIVDGGSSDGTLAVLAAYASRLNLRVIVEQGCNIARGRNVAIAAARGEVIACTDAGVRLEPCWLEELLAPFVVGPESGRLTLASSPSPLPSRPSCPSLPSPPADLVVCGFFVADPRSVFETAMGATVLPRLEEIDPPDFLPSSRSVAFSRRAWERVGGYPEWLDYCEDLIFDLDLRRAGVPFRWAPRAIAHFRPRSSLRSFYRQYYQYARGDGKADLWRRRHAIRYGAYLAGALALAGGLWQPWLWGLLLLGGLAYLWQPYRRLWALTPGWRWWDRLLAAIWVPVIRATGDVAKMAGYPAGVWWGRRRRQTERKSTRAAP